jgi:hypothetical protein
MQYVNTKIVNALLTLRGVSLNSLCGVTGLSQDALSGWLADAAKEDDERLSYDRQLEVLKVLGIVGDTPRADITHHWAIEEPFTGERESAYEPLRLMLACFGKAEIIHLAPAQDNLFSFKAKTHFGLTFRKFRAVLEVRSSPFRSLAFNPVSLTNLTWAGSSSTEDNAGTALVLDTDKFRQLTAPGESTPGAFDRERVQALEYLHWNKLTQLADERGVGASEIAVLIADKTPPRAALTSDAQPKKPVAVMPARDPNAPVPNAVFLSGGVGSGPSAAGKARRATGGQRKRANKAPNASPAVQAPAATAAPLPATIPSDRESGK